MHCSNRAMTLAVGIVGYGNQLGNLVHSKDNMLRSLVHGVNLLLGSRFQSPVPSSRSIKILYGLKFDFVLTRLLSCQLLFFLERKDQYLPGNLLCIRHPHDTLHKTSKLGTVDISINQPSEAAVLCN